MTSSNPRPGGLAGSARSGYGISLPPMQLVPTTTTTVGALTVGAVAGDGYYGSAPPHPLASPESKHKKEIKRRTKTGCLTCRTRRIKVRVDREVWEGVRA